MPQARRVAAAARSAPCRAGLARVSRSSSRKGSARRSSTTRCAKLAGVLEGGPRRFLSPRDHALARHRDTRDRASAPPAFIADDPRVASLVAESDRAHAVSRHHHLSARRYPHQGRSRFDGGIARGARAADRPSRRRLLLAAQRRDEGAAGAQQISAAPRARPLRAARADRAAEDGLRRADRCRGCAGRCGTGRRACSTSGASSAKAFFAPAPIRAEMAASISPASATGSIRSGTC